MVVCFDFDGVIHSYKSGWKSVDVIPDPPVDGIREVMQELKDAGCTMVVFTTRAVEEKGWTAVYEWCNKNKIPYDLITALKPPAVVYVDDRGLKFEGRPMGWLRILKDFIRGIKDESLFDLEFHLGGKHYQPLCELDDANERWKYCPACSCLICPYMKDRRP